MSPWDVAEAADAVVEILADEQVRKLVEVLTAGPAPAVKHTVRGLGPQARPVVATFLALGQASELAPALASAALVSSKRAKATERLSLVWTKPPTVAVTSRPTSEVILELVGSAQSRLTIATYSASGVDELIKLLHKRHQDGVDIRLLLETPGKTGWGPDSLKEFAAIRQIITPLLWPRVLRGQSADYTTMHVKVVIRDEDAVLISSANLSTAAMDRNMELGVLVEGGQTARQLQAHFDELVERGALTPAPE